MSLFCHYHYYKAVPVPHNIVPTTENFNNTTIRLCQEIKEAKKKRNNNTMNCKEHHLPELELATGQVREALQAILYTILL